MKILIILSIIGSILSNLECYKNGTGKKRNFDTNQKVWVKNWPKAIVPYVLDSKLPVEIKVAFQCAINEYQTRTCIKFIPRKKENIYMKVGYNPNVCGFANGTNVDIGDKCGNGSRCGVLIHEIGHILGYANEQDRWDRDKYIEGPGLAPKVNFETFCLMYDYVSIEHDQNQCSMYGGPWKPKLPGVTACGGGQELSVLDTNKFNACYKCKGCYAYRWIDIQCYNPKKHQLFQGGYEFGPIPLYVCRGWHYGDIIPGKAKFPINERPYCIVGYLEKEYKLFEFEVLINPKSGGANLQWFMTSYLPPNAIAGGRVSDRTTYYIGRCFISYRPPYSLVIGKIYANDTKTVLVTFGGKEMECETRISYLTCVKK